MNLLKKLNAVFYQFSKKAAAFMLLILIVSITLAVFYRYILNSPFTWTEELATFLFIWISFLGATTATYEKRHVSIDFLIERFPRKVNDIIKIFTTVLILVFMVLVVVGSFILFPTMTHVSVALHIPKYLYYSAIASASVMMFSMYIVELVELVHDMLNRGKEVELK
jgi:TRAP-type C4-dicarboxylate transport system permease small subunit